MSVSEERAAAGLVVHLFIMCVFMVYMHTCAQHTCGGQGIICENWFSPSPMGSEDATVCPADGKRLYPLSHLSISHRSSSSPSQTDCLAVSQSWGSRHTQPHSLFTQLLRTELSQASGLSCPTHILLSDDFSQKV